MKPAAAGNAAHHAGRLIRFGSSSEEVALNWSKWIRQIHRWLSIAFTVTVVTNFVAMGLGEPPAWVVYSPLLPLFLLLFTGLYMFALPYAAKWRSG
jgi:cellulose synthase/poly-beta-1,6-N-acetylglucosamine synthase-like glycosyltransferase